MQDGPITARAIISRPIAGRKVRSALVLCVRRAASPVLLKHYSKRLGVSNVQDKFSFWRAVWIRTVFEQHARDSFSPQHHRLIEWRSTHSINCVGIRTALDQEFSQISARSFGRLMQGRTLIPSRQPSARIESVIQ